MKRDMAKVMYLSGLHGHGVQGIFRGLPCHVQQPKACAT